MAAAGPMTCSAIEKDTIVKCLTFTLFFLGIHPTKEFRKQVPSSFRTPLSYLQDNAYAQLQQTFLEILKM